MKIIQIRINKRFKRILVLVLLMMIETPLRGLAVLERAELERAELERAVLERAVLVVQGLVILHQ